MFCCLGASEPVKASWSSTFFRKCFTHRAARQNEAVKSVFCRIRIMTIRVRWRACCLPTSWAVGAVRYASLNLPLHRPPSTLWRCFLTGRYLTSHSRVLFKSCKSPTWSGISLNLRQLLMRQGDAVRWWTPTRKYFGMLISASDAMIPV